MTLLAAQLLEGKKNEVCAILGSEEHTEVERALRATDNLIKDLHHKHCKVT